MTRMDITPEAAAATPTARAESKTDVAGVWTCDTAWRGAHGGNDMTGWSLRRRALLALLIPAVVSITAGPMAASAAPMVPVGGGVVSGSITWGTDTAPALVAPCVSNLAGHASFDMTVAFSAGSASYTGPIHVDTDFVLWSPTACGTYLGTTYTFVHTTMAGSSPSGTITCDPAQVTWSGSGAFSTSLYALFEFGVIVRCNLNGTQLPTLDIGGPGTIAPTSVDVSGHVTSAVANAALTIFAI
jgi:hypothetical protein